MVGSVLKASFRELTALLQANSGIFQFTCLGAAESSNNLLAVNYNDAVCVCVRACRNGPLVYAAKSHY